MVSLSKLTMDTEITKNELSQLTNIRQRLIQVRAQLTKSEFPALDDVSAWYAYLAELKSIQGNFNNDVSFLATLMAKQYLEEKYGLQHYDAALKPQGASGLDIDVHLPDGQHLIAEIKTTTEEQALKNAATMLLKRLREEKPVVLVQDWHRDQQSQTRVKVAIEKVLDKNLPESYDRPTFREVCGRIYSLIFERATQGLGWAG